MWRITLCIIIMALAAFGKVSYEGYRLFSIVPTTNKHLLRLEELRNKGNGQYSFWREPSILHKEAFIMVAPHKLKEFYEIMNNIKMQFEVRIQNIQRLIDNTTSKSPSQSFDFKDYHTLEVIYSDLDDLAKKYPHKVQVIVGGVTYEGREIKGVKIISDETKSGVFIEGGMHGREWISPATVMYILHQLLSSNDSSVRYVADSHNWFIFPVFNPDGYVFSHEMDRLWKKTRKPSSPTCIGSDPGKNWDIHWNVSDTSKDPCDDNYPGSEPFSEIETQTMSQYIKSNIQHFNSYISFHSFSQQLIFASNHMEKSIYCYEEMYRLGSVATKALKQKYNTEYVTGCVDQFYLRRDFSIDYIKNVLDKLIVFMYELRDKGQYGYLLPPEQIIPTGEETLDSLIEIFKTLLGGHIGIYS